MVRVLLMLAKYIVLLAGMALGGVRVLHGAFWLGVGILAVALLATLAVAAVEARQDAFDRDQNRSQPQG